MVLVRAGCSSCGRSRRLVAQLRTARPGADVRVVAVDTEVDGAADLPVTLVGTPMWVCDGRLAWLGTPELPEVLHLLDRRSIRGHRPGKGVPDG